MLRVVPPPRLMLMLRVALAVAGAANPMGLLGCGGDDAPTDPPDGAIDEDAGTTASLDASVACLSGVDSDFDLLDDATECELGLDPNDPDADDDGVRDGVEVGYPRICVATDSASQRRDPVVDCDGVDECMEGEVCLGLDPRNPDSDGDGVPDGMEDLDFDGVADGNRGETDPRLADTDGDGTTDDQEGIAICRPDGLAMPTRENLPMGRSQVALAGSFGAVRSATMGDASGLVFEDADAVVAALAVEAPASATDIAQVAAGVDRDVTMALPGATGILLGRTFVTHDGHEAATSFFRVGTMERPDVLRDALFGRLVGTAAPTSAISMETVSAHYLEVTTVLLVDEMRVAVLAAVAPAARFDDDGAVTAPRVRDFTNASGLSARGRVLDADCGSWSAAEEARADFLWFVDTSISMYDDQERLGDVADRFARRLREALVDFRVGVFEASHTNVTLTDHRQCTGDMPGFRFLNGGSPSFVTDLQYAVTREAYMGRGADRCEPYDLGAGQEEPLAASVLTIEEFERYRDAGSVAPNRTLREDTRVVAFFVTDESGANDDVRFFATDTPRWGATAAARIRAVTEFFESRGVLTFGLVHDPGNRCPSRASFAKCVIQGGSGALIPIASATDAEIAVATDRMVEAVAGAASRYVFESVPISATIKVAVDGGAVPRSRANGFDYDGASNSIVFRGAAHRPRVGSEVVVSYRRWGRLVE